MCGLLWIAPFVLLSSPAATGAAGPATRRSPGDIPPVEVRAAADRAVEVLRAAMTSEDEAAVTQAAGRLRDAWGEWAGVPERRSVFAAPDPDTPVTPERLKRLWADGWASAQKGYRGNGRWGLPAAHPEVEHTLLRETAYVISGGLAALRHRAGDTAQIRLRVDEGLAYLLSVQRPDGLFPFPDMRTWHRHFKGPLESLYHQHPEAFQNGWIVEDYGDGGLQFDNGVCAAVFLDAYQITRDTRYRDAARKACRWAAGRPVVPNWNYNAFSVWALARYVDVTGDTEFLQAAVRKARLGVLPGQLPDGRWADPHNARTVYHAIILRALATLYRILPTESPERARFEDALRRAEATLIDELYTRGASDTDHSFTALWAARRTLGSTARRTGALRILANAVISRVVDGRQPAIADSGMLAVGQAMDAFAPDEE